MVRPEGRISYGEPQAVVTSQGQPLRMYSLRGKPAERRNPVVAPQRAAPAKCAERSSIIFL